MKIWNKNRFVILGIVDSKSIDTPIMNKNQHRLETLLLGLFWTRRQNYFRLFWYRQREEDKSVKKSGKFRECQINLSWRVWPPNREKMTEKLEVHVLTTFGIERTLKTQRNFVLQGYFFHSSILGVP